MDNIQKVVSSLHPLERKVLPVLAKTKDFSQIQSITKLQEVEILRALQWLENKNIIKTSTITQEFIELDKNGNIYLKQGLPERRFLNVLDKPLSLEEIKEKANLNKDELEMSIGLLKKKGFIILDKKISLTEQGKRAKQKESLEELFLKALPLNTENLADEQRYAFQELSKRKEVIKEVLKKQRNIILTDLGEKLIKQNINQEFIEALTPTIIKSELWKKIKFRNYDLKSAVPKIYPGKKHPITEALEYIRRIWLDMGFQEMQGNMIQSSFWNFDALFVPQDHPARDLQDTLFLKNPERGNLPNKELVKRISKTHEEGWTTGSKGWNYTWNKENAQLNVLRTHTTVLSAQTISKLKITELPAKFFSIGKVFRNEALDWSHLFEFYQSEGIVVDENVNFRNLLGYLKEFFNKMGFKKVRFRPGYFPYVEMGLECDIFHSIRKRWIELGGAGIFRPEVVKPLLGKDIPVLAWGLGIERIVTLYYEINDIRELYSNDLKKLREFKTFLP